MKENRNLINLKTFGFLGLMFIMGACGNKNGDCGNCGQRPVVNNYYYGDHNHVSGSNNVISHDETCIRNSGSGTVNHNKSTNINNGKGTQTTRVAQNAKPEQPKPEPKPEPKQKQVVVTEEFVVEVEFSYGNGRSH